MSEAAKVDDSLPPFKPLPQKPPKVTVEHLPDGSITIASDYPLEDMPRSVPHMLEEAAATYPDRNFIGERDMAGEWQFVTYGDANTKADAIATALLARGMGPDTPIMVLSGNAIEHGVLMLGAMKARVPVAPISVPYSLMSPGHEKLKHVVAVAKPKMIYVDNAELFAGAIADIDMDGIELVVCEAKSGGADKVPAGAITYEGLCATAIDAAAVKASMDKITHETVGKYLFTSGSTGMPKGVLQTHGMMCAVVAGQDALRDEPVDPDDVPETLEWMPWNHISAGNISFNNVLKNAGTLYLDAGKPIPGMFDQTIANLREVSPQVFGSAPIAFAMLADAMERDEALRKSFFAKLKYMAYGGATLSNDLYDRMQALAIAETGMRMPLTTMYGATETQGITVVHWITERVGLIGLPLPGLTLKLVPNGTKKEVRVKGPTVTPGYLNDPDKTADAFDEDGFYKLGDAGKFVDPDDPAQGLIFDGRVTEDFKLSSGTWVSAGTLRADVVAAASPLLQDAVVCGLDKPFVALLAWPNMAAVTELAVGASTPEDMVKHPAVVAAVKEKIAAHNKDAGGSSARIKRVHLMTEPPSIDGHEITDKGYINQRATLERRAALVDVLYADDPDDQVIVI
ncbi:AMP-binding protein [Pyruvatibacter sp. HU-CL02332]|uniref:AMP-binding protein n=1 Tax=Pyruvatibacter sp. HU-CL02332 TaxID=3127650 RepID=UPI00310C4E44